MSALYDPDDPVSEAELMAQRYVEAEAARVGTLQLISEVRLALTTVALAQAAGANDEATLEQLYAELTAAPIEILADAVMVAVWDGGRPVEHVAADLANAMQAPAPAAEPVCPDPWEHDREMRAGESWWRRSRKPPVRTGWCGWCGNRLPSGGIDE